MAAKAKKAKKKVAKKKAAKKARGPGGFGKRYATPA